MRPGFEIDHIGVAVENLEKGFELYKSMGWTEFNVEVVPTEKVKVGFIQFENNVSIELLEPTTSDSVIAKFLSKKGPGIHHICYRVKDIEKVMEKLKNEGVRLLDEKPRKGAHNCKVCFIHPKDCSGVLIELSEKEK
jgi:methylmalonyl-CoA/ethylmalonyl-CoA epimerase